MENEKASRYHDGSSSTHSSRSAVDEYGMAPIEMTPSRMLDMQGNPLNRTTSRQSETLFPNGVDLNYPFTTTRGAPDVAEYNLETQEGLYRDPTINEEDEELVTWTLNDPENPHNWSKGWKWYITLVNSLLVVCSAFGSSVIAGDLEDVSRDLHVGPEVANLACSLTVLGFGVGPLVISPLSEMIGRRIVYLVALAIYIVFQIPCALAPNIACLLVCRFISGLFGCAPLTLAGGVLSDIWETRDRGLAIAFFAAGPYAGPTIGPLVGGWIGVCTKDFRWIFWVNMIYMFVMYLLNLPIPETYAPVLLRWRAQRIRKETGRKVYTAQEKQMMTLREIIQVNLLRPLSLLATEPILLSISLYIALVYALLYGYFFAYPNVFVKGKGLNEGITGLMFIPVLVGVFFALLTTPFIEKQYMAKLDANNGKSIPEWRLIGMLIAAPFIPLGLLIFGWTSYPQLIWIGPAFSGAPFGYGMVLFYFSANNYLIDVYQRFCASALAAKTMVRSAGGAAFPMFMDYLMDGMGREWAFFLLGMIAVGVIPIPFIFYFYGADIRKKSKAAIV
ncbi:spermine family transporter [Schizosaccharomyces japonicus yFS275]|uniref:Spermine family transporter n=1 Tax=Schizosaccharomyces japonicus (strain yFS275 / FY16936) TaxID=402676 RepID=B6K277_SCHJY|nr:spermine family transporter [Schizosaccharomyces japonicus yFS275]EEB07258.2 spermine family transporter [Schizosaccharomyces japonicus yFS275]